VVGDLVIGKFPDSGTTLSSLSSYYADHHARVAAGGMVLAWAALLLAVFGCALWGRLREADAHPALAVAVLVATAAAVAGDAQGGSVYWTLGHISTESGVSPAALQAWHVAGSEGGLGAGVALLLLAVGVAGVLGRGVPRWLAWPAIALGLLQMTPVGFFASLLFLLWAAATGVSLARAKAPRVPAVAPAHV
jgi:hypothetical protein